MRKYFIVEIQSFEGDDTTIDVRSPAGDQTWAMGSLHNGVIVLDDYGYGSEQEAKDTLRKFLKRGEEIKKEREADARASIM